MKEMVTVSKDEYTALQNQVKNLVENTGGKQAEQPVKLLSYALDYVHEGAFLIDQQHRVVYVNQEACRSLGYDRDELLGMTIFEFNPDAAEEDLTEVRPLAQDGSLIFETRHRTRSGHVFPVEVTATRIDYGGIEYGLGLVRDITKRKDAEKRLKESEQRYRSLVENHPEFIVRFGQDLRYQYANPSVTRASGLPLEEFIGKTLSELHPSRSSNQNEILEGKIREVIDTGKKNHVEAKWETPKGERCFEIVHLPEKDEKGTIVSVLGIARDITELKRAERERTSHLNFLKNMDRINRIIQGTDDPDQMMEDVLDAVMSIFNCDRANLVSPCDPDADTFSVKIERCNPGYEGAFIKGAEIPITPEQAETMRILLEADGPVKFGPGCPYDIPREVPERFNIKSFLSMALYPKIGKPWRFEVHQCAVSRTWTPEEVALFQGIGTRLADGLTGLLAYRNLIESEHRFRMIFENSPVSIWEEDFSAVKGLFDDLRRQGVSDIEAWFDRHPETVKQCAESAKIIDVNRATLALHGAETKEELMAGLVRIFTPESFETFRKELICLWDGGTEMVENAVVKTLSGDSRYVTVYFSVCPGHEQTLSKVLVSLIDVTDRKRAEALLAASEQRMFRCLSNMPGFAYTFRRLQDGHFNFPYASPGIEGLYGLQPEDVKEDMAPLHLLVHPEDRPCTEAAIAESARTMTLFRKEFRICPPNASERWIEASSMPTRDVDGSILWHGVMLDITDRKRAENELRNSERHFRTLFDNIPVCITRFDENCRIAYMNRAVEKFFGVPVKEFEGRMLSETGYPASDTINKKLESMIRQVFTEGVANRTEEIWETADGVRVFDVLHVPEIDEDGKLTDVLGIANDITDRKHAEAEVERLKNYLANIIDSMPLVLAGIDSGGIVTQWNRRAMEMTGVSSPEAVGRPVVDLLPGFSPWITQMQGEMARHRPASMEKLLIEQEGHRCFYDLLIYPLVADGVEGAVLCIEDVTEQARIQEMIVQTEKMMSLGGLAAGMAHEINNPLGIITQAAQNIERRVLTDLPANREAADEIGISIDGMKAYHEKRQIPEFIGAIREASGRASRIITNILRFSRGSETTLQLGSLTDVLDQALVLAASDFDLKKKYDFRSIEIVRDDAPDMPEVPMVSVEMEQVILNLLKNATHAMVDNPPDRRPRINLHLRREQRYAVIEVVDNGSGMTQEIRRRVFEPFFTTKEPGIGTGLGLSVSYMIVTQNHKGLMEVASAPGEGACFTVRLPLPKKVMT